MIVWTVPPSSESWSAALATVNPVRVVLFANRPDSENNASFLNRLAALIKYALKHKEGRRNWRLWRQRWGSVNAAYKSACKCLRALGKLDYRLGKTGEYHLTQRDGPPSDDLNTLQNRLDMILRETRAYRDYWQQMQIRG